MVWPKSVLMVAVLSALQAAGEYRKHETIEENNHDTEEKSGVDYTKYFGGFGDVIRGTNSEPPSERTLGFNRPSGQMEFFEGGPFGVNFMSGGTYGGVLPTSNGTSSNLSQPLPKNESEVVENNKFQSLFDTRSSASETDARSHDFRPRLRSEASRSRGLYSPSFSTLKKDIDREVDYQKKEGSVGSTEAADRKESSDESKSVDLDGFDFSEFNLDESNELNSAEHSSEEHETNSNERDDSSEDTSIEPTPVTPISVVNHFHKPSSYGPPSKIIHTYRPHGSQEHVPPQEYSNLLPRRTPKRQEIKDPGYYKAERTPENPVGIPHSALYYRPLVYNSPGNLNGYSRAYYPLSRSKVQTNPYYKPVLTRSGGTPHISRNLNLQYRPKPLFHPSPRDISMDYSPNTHLAKRRAYPVSALPRHGDRLTYSQIDTEDPTNYKQPAVTADKQKKICKKANRKMNSKEFPRFEQQQMVCYTCSDKQRNSTYEECRYESEPGDGSFYERVAETRSFQTVFPLSSVHPRRERSVGESNDKRLKTSSKHVWILKRRKREFDYEDDEDSDEQNRDYDSFKHNLDHSSSSEERSGWNRGNLPASDEYSFEEDDSEEVSDIEKEFQSPEISEDGRCRTVFKKGLFCMVCKNSLTGSSSEQCSYSSDPDDNRYEYSSQSSYGSKRNPSSDRQKRFNSISNHQKRRLDKKPLQENRYYHPANLRNENRPNNGVETRKSKIGSELTNSEYLKTPFAIPDTKLKVDQFIGRGAPEPVEHSSYLNGFQGKEDNYFESIKREAPLELKKLKTNNSL